MERSLILTAADVSAGYGPLTVLRGVSLEVGSGERVAIVGANGAGKTTLLRALSRLLPLRTGAIRFCDREISSAEAHTVARLGLAHVPEGRQIFPRLTVKENLMLGAYARTERGTLQRDMQRAFELFPVLKERLSQLGSLLSGGEQQMLAISRAILMRPRMLLLDEPSMGIAPKLVSAIFDALLRLNTEDGLPILFVEQNARLALRFATRAYVLETGSFTLSGESAALAADPRIEEAYLGKGAI